MPVNPAKAKPAKPLPYLIGSKEHLEAVKVALAAAKTPLPDEAEIVEKAGHDPATGEIKPPSKKKPKPAKASPAAILQEAAAEVARLAEAIHGSETRDAWEAIGSALLRARNVSVNQVAFGAWIVANAIPDLPGLGSAASRSDAIWLAERPECAGFIAGSITHPRRIRMAWRKLLAETAVEVLAQEDPDPMSDNVSEVMMITGATEPEAIAALAAAKVIAGTAAFGSVLPWSPSLLPIKAALKKAKKAGVTYQVLSVAVVEVYGDWPFTGPGPAPQSKPSEPTLDEALAVMAKAGGYTVDRAGALAWVDANFPAPHRTAVEIYDALKAALAEAEAAGVLLDEAKDAVMGVYWGIEKAGS